MTAIVVDKPGDMIDTFTGLSMQEFNARMAAIPYTGHLWKLLTGDAK